MKSELKEGWVKWFYFCPHIKEESLLTAGQRRRREVVEEPAKTAEVREDYWAVWEDLAHLVGNGVWHWSPLLGSKTAAGEAALMAKSVLLPLYNWTLWILAKISLQAGCEILPNSPPEEGITPPCNRRGYCIAQPIVAQYEIFFQSWPLVIRAVQFWWLYHWCTVHAELWFLETHIHAGHSRTADSSGRNVHTSPVYFSVQTSSKAQTIWLENRSALFILFPDSGWVSTCNTGSAGEQSALWRMDGLNLNQSCSRQFGLLLVGLEKDEGFPRLISTQFASSAACALLSSHQWGNCSLLLLFGAFCSRYGFLYCFTWHLAVWSSAASADSDVNPWLRD